MKKLMIAAAIVCAAAITQAATVTWGTGYLKGPADTTKSGSSAATGDYLKNIVGSEWTVTLKIYSDSLGATLVASDAVKLTYDGKTFSTARVAVDSKVAPTTLGTVAGTFSSTAKGTKVANDKWSGLSDGTEYYYQILVKGGVGETWSAEKASAITAFETAESSTGSVTINASTATELAGWASQAWTVTATSAVPEPTSAMLILLGMAGLALRRRRA